MDFLEPLKGQIIATMNDNLSSKYTKEEAKSALLHMHPTKASRLDGMPSYFIRKNWHLVGDFVSTEVLKVLNTGRFSARFNCTFITLVSKKEWATKVMDFQPISLCNVLYKLVAKVIANRFKQILPSIFFKSQSTFVPERHISNNYL